MGRLWLWAVGRKPGKLVAVTVGTPVAVSAVHGVALSDFT
jgi:hypothetical protein